MGKIIRGLTTCGQMKIMAIEGHSIVNRAAEIHRPTPVVLAALGRQLLVTSMLGARLKVENGSVTTQIKGGGEVGTLLCVSDAEGFVRGCVTNPLVTLPLKANGKLDVGGAVGRNGSLQVVYDLQMKEPYAGSCALVSGEIGEDFAAYFVQSEQVPTVVNVGVLVDRDYSAAAAGGYIIQLLPTASEETITRIEENVQAMKPITTLLSDGCSIEDIAAMVTAGFELQILETTEADYRCSCSRKRVEQTIISLGISDIDSLIETGESAEVTCQFCDEKYLFSVTDLLTLKALLM